MTMTSLSEDSSSDLSAAVALFRSLADPRRLAIVHELAAGERRVVDLTRSLGMAQSTVSAHLACLADCGLVASRPVGRQSFYRLTQPTLLGVLAAAEQLLAATGNAVALCRTYGAADTDGVVSGAASVPPKPTAAGSSDGPSVRVPA